MKKNRILFLIIVLALSSLYSGVSASGGTKQGETPEPGSTDFQADLLPKGNPKLDSTMSRLAAAADASPAEALDLAHAQGLRLSGDRVHVQIFVRAAGRQAVVAAVERAGGEVTGVAREGSLLQGWLPAAALESLAGHKDVHYIRRPARVQLFETPQAGQSTTEGLAVINGPAWHAAGYTGADVKVGIIDGGFSGYTGLLGSDLPASVTVKNFVDGESDAQVDGDTPHGTACAEVVHDIAPDATLYLAKISTNVDLAEAVAWLRDTHGVDVISTSLGFYNLTPGDGTGELADLVQAAREAGILWVTAAGNDRQAHWGGPYVDASGNNSHEFNGQEVNYFVDQDGNPFYVPSGYRFHVFLRWDDWTDVDQDYDLFLTRWNGAQWEGIASSDDPQNGQANQTPTEYATAVTSGGTTLYGFAIMRYAATRDVHFEAFAPKFTPLDQVVYDRSLANLADAPDAVTVAALDVTDPFPQEPYSSQGPTNGPGGAGTGGLVKPDLSGFANVATESYEDSTFNGTSAATPHVAGAAALVLSAYPDYTPDQLQSFLEQGAVDMGGSGQDTLFGHGRLYLGAPREKLTVTGFAPVLAPNDRLLSGATITGTGFAPTTTVRLILGTQEIPGQNLAVDPDLDRIVADFDLDGAAAGAWDVRVANAGGVSDTLPAALTVYDVSAPDLQVSKAVRYVGTATPGRVEPGSLLTYTIGITNGGFGAVATGVRFTDTLPDEVTFVSLSPPCSGGGTLFGTVQLPGGNGFACPVQGGSLVLDQNLHYTLVVRVAADAQGEIVNRVQVGSDQPDANPEDNTASVSVRTGGGTLYLPLVTKDFAN